MTKIETNGSLQNGENDLFWEIEEKCSHSNSRKNADSSNEAAMNTILRVCLIKFNLIFFKMYLNYSFKPKEFKRDMA